ncbi:tyrosine-type recombinase/integrase [Labilibaculum filiforme]|uniref:tyrosine-type recombinase/integrase n=1 Tax=Labilibaculum filiforme TaxID=1940526 RepID=UPI001FE8A80D|nr:site-specific integrase [Labilibaculum filiforme]
MNLLKQNFPARWSQTKKCWWIARKDFDYKKFKEVFCPIAEIILPPKKQVDKNTEQILPAGYFEKLIRVRYSESTNKIYSKYFKDFQSAFTDQKLDEITPADINNYILGLIKKQKISPSQQNQRINAIKFYYEKVLGREKLYFAVDRPKKEKSLPNVLSKNEIAAMINSTSNIKHKSLIALIYSCGLRRCEAINMELKDIDSNRMLIKIIASKGKKDRYVQLAKSTLLLLREYYKKHTPLKWVFEGPNSKPYSAKSISNVIKSAAQRAGVKKRVYPHILRHSFATHHLEQGTDLRYIQEWLGHGSSKTTEIYTHVSNKDFIKFKNPIDGLIEDT